MKAFSLSYLLPVVLFCFLRYRYVASNLVSGVVGQHESTNKQTEFDDNPNKVAYSERKQVLRKSDAHPNPQLPGKQYDQTRANWKLSEDISEVISESPIFQAVSPILLQLLLSLFIYGAKDDTLCQLTKALHYEHLNWTELSPEEKRHQLSLILYEINKVVDPTVNLGLFVSEECQLNMDFQQFIEKYLSSIRITVDKLDSQEANVDNWINSQLANTIVKFRGGNVKGGSRFVLAIGAQLIEVFPEYTRYSVSYEDLFHLPCGQSTYINYFTTLEGGLVCYTDNENYTAIVRNLGGGDESLLVAPKTMDVEHLSVGIGDVLKKCTEKKVRLTYPIYSVNKHDDLQVLLKKLGMTSLFSPDEADLKELFDSKEKLYIHDAFVDIRFTLFSGAINARNAIISNSKASYDSFCTSDDELVLFDRPFPLYVMRKSQVVMAFFVSFGASAY